MGIKTADEILMSDTDWTLYYHKNEINEELSTTFQLNSYGF